jgi:hypothetical protein
MAWNGRQLIHSDSASKDGGSQSMKIFVWKPTDRHKVSSWTSVSVERVDWHAADHSDDTHETQRDRVATITIGGKPHEVEFSSAASRQMALRTTADWVVRPRILKVTGVAEAFLLGGDKKQYQVLIDPAALH